MVPHREYLDAQTSMFRLRNELRSKAETARTKIQTRENLASHQLERAVNIDRGDGENTPGNRIVAA